MKKKTEIMPIEQSEIKVVEFDHFKAQAGYGVPQPDRLKRLNEIAIHQMRILSSGGERRLLG